MKAQIQITATVVYNINLDVDDLVAQYGPKAKGKKWLADYAVGNRKDGLMVDHATTVEFEGD